MGMKINKVAVLGTGVMGSQIAAHLTNAGIPVYAFDITQQVAESGIKAATEIKPAAFYNPKNVELISSFNYEKHLDKLQECDWIIEVIAEKLKLKHDLYKKITPFVKSDAILTSNTSGLSASNLAEELDESLKKRFINIF